MVPKIVTFNAISIGSNWLPSFPAGMSRGSQKTLSILIVPMSSFPPTTVSSQHERLNATWPAATFRRRYSKEPSMLAFLWTVHS
jgi:hypothetical protein